MHIECLMLFSLWLSSCIVALCLAYPKKYAHGFCFAVLCCGYTLTDFPISIRLTSLALWQSNDCPSASKATLMNMDKYFMWIHYERLHNHNKAKHNKTVCIFLGIYCSISSCCTDTSWMWWDAMVLIGRHCSKYAWFVYGNVTVFPYSCSYVYHAVWFRWLRNIYYDNTAAAMTVNVAMISIL